MALATFVCLHAQGGAIPIATPGLVRPRLTSQGTIAYPAIARDARADGVVTLSLTVDEAGRVRDAVVAQSSPFFDQTAVDAARQWQFTPGTLEGKPVAVSLTATFRFARNRNAAALYTAPADAGFSTTWLPPDFAVYYSVQCASTALLIDWSATPPVFRLTRGGPSTGIPLTLKPEERETIFLKLVQAGFFSPDDSTEAWQEPRSGVREREQGLEVTVGASRPDEEEFADEAARFPGGNVTSHRLDARAYGVWRRATWTQPLRGSVPAAIRDFAGVARRIREMAIGQDAVRTLPVEQRYCR